MKHYIIFIVTLSAYTSRLRVHAFTVVCQKELRTHKSRTSLQIVGFENEKFTSNDATDTPSLEPKIAKPSHIAFICDGNSRWATHKHMKGATRQDQKNLANENTWAVERGHAKGAARVVSMTQDIRKRYPDVRWITMYAFSTENWTRPTREIEALWKVMEQYCDEFYSWALGQVVIKVIGDLDDERIPMGLRKRLRNLESQTNLALKIDPTDTMISDKDNIHHDEDIQSGALRQPLTLCIAINYGGRKDIVHATRQIVEACQRGELKIDDINEDCFDAFLSTGGIPQPDLVIRTGGDQRISNFLLWQCAYAELYFTDTLWPDFDEKCLDKAIQWYGTRDRRFGGHP